MHTSLSVSGQDRDVGEHVFTTARDVCGYIGLLVLPVSGQDRDVGGHVSNGHAGSRAAR